MYSRPKIKITASDWPSDYGCDGTEKDIMLYQGEHIDRFGSEDGFFFGIAGEPYIYRSLPWFGNYNSNDINNNNNIKEKFYNFYSQPDTNINPEYDYHLYKIIKPLYVKTCNIRPAFGYPGGGTQYRSNINVKNLIQQGFIKEVPWTHSPFFDDYDKGIVIGGKINKLRIRNKKTRRRRHRKRSTRHKSQNIRK